MQQADCWNGREPFNISRYWRVVRCDYAKEENETFERTEELVDEIIMHLNAKVAKPKNRNGKGLPLPKQIVSYWKKENLMKKYS